jgi:hypothetical protein
VDYRIVVAYLRDLIHNSAENVEPIRCTLEAGIKIVAWSSGVDASALMEAAAAEVVDLPAGEADALLTR